MIDGYVEVSVSKYEDFSYEFMVKVERTLKKGGGVYIFSGYQNLRHILNSAAKVGLEDVWTIDREYKTPTKVKNQNELPIKLTEKIIQRSSNIGDEIMDMCLGGFTTTRVALELGKEPLGFEIKNKHTNISNQGFRKRDDYFWVDKYYCLVKERSK